MSNFPRLGVAVIVGAAAIVIASLLVSTPTEQPIPSGPAASTGPPNTEVPVDRLPWSAVAWRQLVGPFAIGPEAGHDRIDGLVDGGGGLIGWGRTSTPGRNQFNDMGAIFLSDTGERWLTVFLDAGVAPSDASAIGDVIAGAVGLIAFGSVCCDAEERSALWISSDGQRWERVPYPEALIGAEITQVIATPTIFVAVGVGADGAAAIWTSPNGQDWSSIDPDKADLGPGGINDVVASATGLLATGWRDTGATYDGAMWRSPDGIDWSPVLMDTIFGGELDTVIGNAVPFAGGWWAHGSEGPHQDRVQCEQLLGRVASVAPPEPPAGRAPTLSCGWGVETIWVSKDGASWDRLPAILGVGVRQPAGELIEFRFVASGGPGLVVLGEGFEDGHPSVFVSADGRTWTRAASHTPFASGQSISGFAVAGRRLIAVGEDWDPNSPRPAVPAVWLGEVR